MASDLSIIKDMEKGKFLPAYLFVGQERYLLQEAIRKVESLMVTPASRCFNYDLFHGAEVSPDIIIEAARTRPMMAERRLIVVKDAEKIPAAGLEKLQKYLKSPSPFSCILLSAEKVDMRKGFFKSLAEVTISFDPLKQNMISAWLIKEASFERRTLEREAADFLAEATGNNLLKLKSELQKAILYAGEKSDIGINDVLAVSTRSNTSTIFNLTDAVCSRNYEKAIMLTGELVESGESGIFILFMITRQFRMVWKVRVLMDKGVKFEQIAKETGIQPFLVKGITEQAKKFSGDMLRDIFMKLLEADISLKTGRLKERLVLESLVLSIVRQPAIRKL